MIISRNEKNNRPKRQVAPFSINTIGSFASDMEGLSALPTLEMFTILWIQEGRGEVTIDLEKFAIEKDMIYYIKPGQSLQAIIEEPANGYLISFKKEFLHLFDKTSSQLNQSALLNHFSVHPVVHMSGEVSAISEMIANRMLQEYHHSFELRVEILRSFLKVFMIYLSRQWEAVLQAEQSRKTEIVSLFFALLEKYYVDKKMVKDYAEMLLVTPGYLNKTVKEVSGFPASYHIQQRVVLEAKRHALFQGQSMKEIAFSLGFCDPAHFSKFFKNSAGTNFRNFKRTETSFTS